MAENEDKTGNIINNPPPQGESSSTKTTTRLNCGEIEAKSSFSPGEPQASHLTQRSYNENQTRQVRDFPEAKCPVNARRGCSEKAC